MNIIGCLLPLLLALNLILLVVPADRRYREGLTAYVQLDTGLAQAEAGFNATKVFDTKILLEGAALVTVFASKFASFTKQVPLREPYFLLG